MKEKFELHVVIDEEGVRSVQIIGPSEAHQEGHAMYFKLQHLFPELDKQIKEILKNEECNGRH